MTFAGFIDGLFLWFDLVRLVGVVFLPVSIGGVIFLLKEVFGINIGLVVVTCAARCDESKEMSIEVDEETFSPYLGIRIYQKNLQYDVNSRKLFINSLTSATTTTTTAAVSPTPIADTSSVSNSSFDDERAMSTSPLLPLTVTVTGKELQDIVEAENEDEDEEEEEEEGDEEVHRVGSNTPLLENIEEKRI
eukprot:gene5637-6057_t